MLFNSLRIAELYNEKIYTDNCGEERMNGEGAIDVKRGTGDGEEVADITDKVIIANNLFYGWRRAGTEGLGRIFDGRTKDCVDLATHPADGDCFHDANGRGGGAGDAITFHLTASNVAVINNTVTDCTNGFQIGGSGGQIEVYDNTICNLYTPHDAYIGDSGNGSYWTNTIYPQNFWYTSGQGVCYDLPSCLASWQCANAPNTYRVNHQVGLAIKSSMESSRISGNKIKKAINGIRLDGTSGRKAVVTRNYIEDILTENLAFPDSNNDGNPDDDCLYEYFYGNTYSDFTNVCWGNGNSFPANKVIENNCFLYCSGYVMGTGTFSCEANCN